jgi:hypothetical protein
MIDSDPAYIEPPGGPESGPRLSPFTCIAPGLLLAVAVAVGGALLFITCLRATPSTSYSTRIDALPQDTPVFLSGPGIYLVRLSDDGVVALDHNEQRREDVINGCVIRWKEALERDGRRGFFRSDCSGALYDLRGTPLDGTGPPMRRHPVTTTKDSITVDFRICQDPAAANATVPCKAI